MVSVFRISWAALLVFALVASAAEFDATMPLLQTAHKHKREPAATISSAIPLTTLFLPPDPCTQGQLTMLPSPGYQIWLNEPVPVPGMTFSSCYPTEFMRDYQSIKGGQSRVPMMSPLICPFGWNAVMTSGYYQACCPVGFSLHTQSTSLLDTRRPAYGGTCFSDWVSGQISTVTGYGESGPTGIVTATATTTPFQVYAHVIDGYVAAAATTTSTPVATVLVSNQPPTVSQNTIIGIVIGCTLGFISVMGLAWCLVRRRRRNGNILEKQEEIQEPSRSYVAEMEATDCRYLAGGNCVYEMNVPPNEVDDSGSKFISQQHYSHVQT
ncbi:hypothetical protein F4778DRAFT_743796 [Xylariomycetidae sp. FL2044]|nr:hypothetical protein F4778DRAFT_743796 [Xylariomycetidae sp. FL2044]